MSLKLSMLDRRLVSHLRLGGTTHDQVGKQLVTMFVVEAMKQPDVKRATQEHRFILSDLCGMYAWMVSATGDNPLIKDPSGLAPFLAASAFFMEPFRIEDLMSRINRDTPKGASPGDRANIILDYAAEAVQQVWQAHTQARGEPRFEVLPGKGRFGAGGCAVGGCGCLVVVGFFVLGPLGYFAAKLMS